MKGKILIQLCLGRPYALGHYLWAAHRSAAAMCYLRGPFDHPRHRKARQGFIRKESNVLLGSLNMFSWMRSLVLIARRRFGPHRGCPHFDDTDLLTS